MDGVVLNVEGLIMADRGNVNLVTDHEKLIFLESLLINIYRYGEDFEIRKQIRDYFGEEFLEI